MSRNHYEEAFGVTALNWKQGDPDQHESTLAIVEVWRTTLHAGGYTGARPQVNVRASIELWAHVDGQWQRVGHDGGLLPAIPADRSGFDVRRWAAPASRHWSGRITLDGWSKE